MCALVPAAAGASAAHAGTLPAGFQETTAFSGLTNPTVVRFAADGRIVVAEKSGLVKVFSGPGDTTAEVVADLRAQVHNFWDRGLLGMALDPNFSSNQKIYVLYTRDSLTPGGTAPHWGTTTSISDPCPSPPGATSDGCVVSGRLSRVQLNGTPNPPETVLIDDWCQQYPSHSIGSLEFDAAGRLYASAGDGASFNFTDWGQDGNPVNPCGDHPVPPGVAQTPPLAEGGALRSQDLRTRTSGDPVSLDGTVIRINPDTGAAATGNPLAGDSNANAKRILAYGLRNPFRFALSPDGELWLGDVGWNSIEEVNSLSTSAPGVVNFGWPCYEGNARQSGYDNANLNLCENLYSEGSGAVTPPRLGYSHSAKVVSGEACPTGSSSLAGLDFYTGGPFPASYDGTLFFADYSRDCIWAMRAGSNGRPDPASVTTFESAASNPVFLEVAPDGALYYADFDGGRIQKIRYTIANQSPTAVATADRTSGSAPLTVNFDGRGSSDPDPGDSVSYAWDLDADGAHDDSASATPSRTYTTPATVTVGLRVTDTDGATDTDTLRIDVGNDPPVPTITAPSASRTWRVGETINFSGAASDPQQGSLPPSGLDWDLILNHCPSNCHEHPIQSYPDTASGSFAAPDHEHPSHLTLRLTATDAQGATATSTRRLDPRTVNVTLASDPPGLELALNADSGSAPLSRTVIEGSTNTISASSPQSLGGRSYTFSSWSDGLGATHSITASSSTTLTATFERVNGAPTARATANPTSGTAPLTVNFNGGGSSDPDSGDSLDYAWDLDGDGAYDDSTAVNPSRTYPSGTVTVGLRVTDDDGASDTDSVTIAVDAPNRAPTALAMADKTTGTAPLTVNFDATGSTDPDGDSLDYAWDLDGDGGYDDSTAAKPSRTYQQGTVTVGLRVDDGAGVTDTDSVTITASAPPANRPPVPTISTPTETTRWRVGQQITFEGGATDPDQGDLPATALHWFVTLRHCPPGEDCHGHIQWEVDDISTGTFTAPDHPHPAALEVWLTATDAENASASTAVRFDPRTVELTMASQPSRLELGLNATRAPTPFTETVLEGSNNTITAPTPQALNQTMFEWVSWTAGGPASQSVIADATTTYTARYEDPDQGPVEPPPDPDPDPDPDPGPPPGADPLPADDSATPPGTEPQLDDDDDQTAAGSGPTLTLKTMRVRKPSSIGKLLRRGSRTKLLCNLDCRVRVKLIAKGRAARQLDVAGVIGAAGKNLTGGEAGWVRVRVSRKNAKRLAGFDRSAKPRIVVSARGWTR